MIELLLRALILAAGQRRVMRGYMRAMRRTCKTPSATTVVVAEEVIVGVIVVCVAAATAAARI